MANIIEITNKNGTRVYKVQIRIAGATKVPARTFPSRSRAEEFERTTEAELREEIRKLKADPNGQSFYKEKLHDTLTLYLASLGEGEHSPAKVALLHVENCKLGDIRPSMVQRFVDKMLSKTSRLGRPYAAQSVRHMVIAMGNAYRWRARVGYDLQVALTPFNGRFLPADWESRRNRRLEASEERALFAEMRRMGVRHYHWRLLVKLALETGARQGELIKSKWTAFDLEKRRWEIPTKDTKAKVARSVPLTKRATRALKALALLRKEGETRPFESLGKLASIRGWWREIPKKAGVVGFRFHDLRHEACSRMVLHHRQLSTFEIMTVVGHSSIAMLRLYANLRGEELVERIDGVGAQQSMLERLGSILRTHEALVASLDARNTSARHPEVVAPPKLGMVFTSQPLTATKFSISWGSTPYRLAA